eukprot:8288178-Pyramimonas_sp.AAC.1
MAPSSARRTVSHELSRRRGRLPPGRLEQFVLYRSSPAWHPGKNSGQGDPRQHPTEVSPRG